MNMLARGWFLTLTAFALLLSGFVDGLRAPSLPFNLANFGSKESSKHSSAFLEIQPLLSTNIPGSNSHGNAIDLPSIPRRNTKLSAASTTAQSDVPVSNFPPVPTQKECLAFVIPALGELMIA